MQVQEGQLPFWKFGGDVQIPRICVCVRFPTKFESLHCTALSLSLSLHFTSLHFTSIHLANFQEVFPATKRSMMEQFCMDHRMEWKRKNLGCLIHLQIIRKWIQPAWSGGIAKFNRAIVDFVIPDLNSFPYLLLIEKMKNEYQSQFSGSGIKREKAKKVEPAQPVCEKLEGGEAATKKKKKKKKRKK